MKDQKKQVLYISYDGMTDPLGQSQVLPYIVGLSDTYRFTLISFEKPSLYIQNKETIETLCSTYQIDWKPLMYTKNPPVLSTVFDVLKMFRLSKNLHQEKQFAIIHCRSYISALVGLSFKKKGRSKFIFDMRGFWADERVDGGIWNLKNPVYKLIYRYFKRKERSFLQHADLVVSLTQKAKDEMLTWGIKKLLPQQISVIPCVADFSLFDLVNTEKRRLAKLKLNLREDQFVLLYLGSIGTWYLLDEMLFFFSILKKMNPDAKFVFLTNHPKEAIVIAGKKFNIGSEDILVHFASRSEITSFAHAADFGIFFIKPSYSKMASSPTKMAELLAMGIPIVCNAGVGNVDELILKTNMGYCVNDFSEATFHQTIEQMYIHRLNSADIRSNASDFLDLKVGINVYSQIYSTL